MDRFAFPPFTTVSCVIGRLGEMRLHQFPMAEYRRSQQTKLSSLYDMTHCFFSFTRGSHRTFGVREGREFVLTAAVVLLR